MSYEQFIESAKQNNQWSFGVKSNQQKSDKNNCDENLNIATPTKRIHHTPLSYQDMVNLAEQNKQKSNSNSNSHQQIIIKHPCDDFYTENTTILPAKPMQHQSISQNIENQQNDLNPSNITQNSSEDYFNRYANIWTENSAKLPSLNKLATTQMPVTQINRQTGIIAGQHVSIHIDTGADINAIDADLARSLDLEIMPLKQSNIITANKQNIIVTGKVQAELTILKLVTLTTTLLLIDNLSDDIILGTTFLKDNKVTINCSTNKLTFPGEPKTKTEVICTHKTELKPNDTTRVKVELSRAVPDYQEQGIMEVGKTLVNKGVWFPDTIITYERKPVYIVISNYSKEFVILETGQKLGQWKPLHQRWEARLLTNEECDKAIADHQHAISALAENPKPIIRDWDKEFNLNKTDLTEQEKIELRTFLDEFRDVCSTGDDDIGKSNIIRHTIETRNALPIRQPLRRINPNYRLQMEEMTQDRR